MACFVCILCQSEESDADGYIITRDGLDYTVNENTVTLSGYEGDPTEVVIPSFVYYDSETKLPVTAMDDKIFRNCTTLTSVTIPDSISVISYYAFYNCTSLTSVTLSDSVTSISSYAFSGCSALTSISLPDSVRDISSSAFYGCKSLSYVGIGKNLDSVGGVTFVDCPALKTIEVDPENPYLTASNGILYSKDMSVLYVYAGGLEDAEFTVPSTVTSIDSLAFARNTHIVSVTIPDSVKTVGSDVFSDCTSLESVSLGNSLIEIGFGMFEDCTSLSNVVIGSSVTTLGTASFKRCGSLETVSLPGSLTTIKDEAFEDCSGLAEIVIPEKVTDIGDSVFSSCVKLTNVTLNNSLETLGASVFYGCTGLTGIVLPESLTTMGHGLLSGCTGLTSVTIPAKVTDIPEYLLRNCTKLTSVEIEGRVTSIGNYAFEGCGLKSVTIPDYVEYIGKYAFQNDAALSSVSLGSRVASIDKDAFNGCTALTKINNRSYLELTAGSDDYGKIAKYATEITGSPGTAVVGEFNFNYNDSTLECTVLSYLGSSKTVSIPGTVTIDGKSYKVAAIGESALCNQTLIESISIPESVTTIESSAFKNCCSLTSVTLSDRVTTLAESAFEDCTDLASVKIGAGLMTIGDKAFKGCTALSGIELGSSVTTLGESAFEGCTSLNAVSIPDSVVTIGKSAFKSCSALAEIGFGSSVRTLGKNAFEGCGFKSLVIPDSVTDIGYYCFDECKSLETVTLSDSLRYIPDSAFSDCIMLKSITIPDSVDYIGEEAFSGCTSLSDVHFGNALTEIQFEAFADCTSLSSIIFPDTLENLGKKAFSGCRSIICVSFGKSLVNLDSSSLGPCVFFDADGVRELSIAMDLKGHTFKGDNCFKLIIDDSHDHEYVLIPGKDATCTVSGYKEHYQCSICHLLFIKSDRGYTEVFASDLVLAPLGHNLQLIASKDATCTTDGTLAHYKCSACEKLFTKSGDDYAEVSASDLVIHKLGHNMTAVAAKGATCTEAGNNAYYTCDRCNKVFKDSEGASETTVETETIPAIGHKEEIVEGKAATCTESGLTDGKRCTVCGTVTVEQTVIPALGHEEEIVEGKAATCTESGLTDGKRCTVCGTVLVPQTVIPATGHSPAKSVTENYLEPSCITTGSYDLVVYCSICGQELSRQTVVIPVIPSAELVRDGSAFSVSVTDEIQYISSLSVKTVKDAAAKDSSVTLAVTCGPAIISFDSAAILCLITEDTFVSVTQVYGVTVPGIVGEATAYEFVFGDNHTFGSGNVSISVEYSGTHENLEAYYIVNDQVKEVLDCIYADGRVTFTAGHLSVYAIGDEKVSSDGMDTLIMAISAIILILSVICIANAVKKSKI